MSFHYHLDQINQAVDYLDEFLQSTVICFDGPIGAGKTTLISRLCQRWKVTDSISSPTFSIVNHYNSTTKGLIYHFDFYRLESVEEALDIGTEEYLESGNICMIEWSERILALLPKNFSRVNIEINSDQSRSLKIVSL
tara:strand:- start:962 stop:1375 length:414 start_codon:yes stop_codon:yes gene_type:complete